MLDPLSIGQKVGPSLENPATRQVEATFPDEQKLTLFTSTTGDHVRLKVAIKFRNIHKIEGKAPSRF